MCTYMANARYKYIIIFLHTHLILEYIIIWNFELIISVKISNDFLMDIELFILKKLNYVGHCIENI